MTSLTRVKANRRTSQRRKLRKSLKKVRRRRSRSKSTIIPSLPSIPAPSLPIPLVPIRYKKGISIAALVMALTYLSREWSPQSAGNIKNIGDNVLGALSIAGGPIPPEPGAPKQWNQKIGILKGQAKWIYDFIMATDRFKQRFIPHKDTP